MQTTKLILTLVTALLIAACGTTKKATTAAAASTNTTTPTTSTTTPATNNNSPFPLVRPVDGSPAPGNEELTAIQLQYKEVILEKLKEGHEIYTVGACIHCHGAANIYQFEVTKWKDILDEMAPKAYLSDAQKDAVYKYVLSIKATQTK